MIFDGAKWISNGVREYVGTVEGVYSNPAPYFRKEFKVPRRPLKATLYVTAKGMYEAYINDALASDQVMTPGFTDYNKLILYQEFDVTDRINRGINVLGAVVSEGWYAGELAFKKQRYFGTWPVCLLMKLVLEYKDGKIQEVVTDSGFKTTTGRILASSLLDGEVVDNRLPETYEMFYPNIDTSDWVNATEEGSDFSLLAPQEDEPVRFAHRLRGVPVGEDRGVIYDFGQNAAGILMVKLKAEEGTKVTLRHAEMLDNGKLYTANLRSARCEDIFYCREGKQILVPTFTIHGFRYAEIVAEGGEIDVSEVFFYICHNDLVHTGCFRCSSELVNKIYENVMWGQRSNFISIPTDCPQRDERLGWTGDAQIFCATAMYNFDCNLFFARYLREMRLAAHDDGAIPDVVPELKGLTGAGTAAWADAICVIPYTHYLMYGDKKILSDNLDAMKAWVEYQKRTSNGLIRPAEGYGDWLSLFKETDKGVLATAYFAYSTLLTAKSLDALGYMSGDYHALYNNIKEAFNNEFTDSRGVIKSDTQTCYLLALAFGLCEDKKRCFNHLLRTLEETGWRLATGFVGVSLLLPVLCDYGRADLAYKLILSTEFPSWGYTIENGATTIWERWNSYTKEDGFGDEGMNSFNHYSLGSCVQWMYAYMIGIRPTDEAPGFKKVIIEPYTDPLHRITSASGSYQGDTGRIDVEWEDDGTFVVLNIYKPAEVGISLRINGEVISLEADGEATAISMLSGAEEITVRYMPRYGGSQWNI